MLVKGANGVIIGVIGVFSPHIFSNKFVMFVVMSDHVSWCLSIRSSLKFDSVTKMCLFKRTFGDMEPMYLNAFEPIQ